MTSTVTAQPVESTQDTIGLVGSRLGDHLFKGGLILTALAIPVLMLFLVIELYSGARLAIDRYGLGFITGST